MAHRPRELLAAARVARTSRGATCPCVLRRSLVDAGFAPHLPADYASDGQRKEAEVN